MKDDLLDYLITTDTLDDFLGLKEEYKEAEAIDKEIKEIENYIKKLKNNGILTDWQKKDLEYNENRLKELRNLKNNY